MTDNEFMELDRIQKIQSINRQYDLEHNAFLSFSGGRDSTVLSAFLDVALPNNHIPRIFSNTGIELNEIRHFVERERDDRIQIIKPSVPIKQMLEKEGYPFKSKEYSDKMRRFKEKRAEGIDRKEMPYYIRKWTGDDEGYKIQYKQYTRFMIPKSLEYQLEDDFTMKISDHCCLRMKEEPLDNWGKENHRSITMTAIMMAEGGRRSANVNSGCLIFRKNGEKFFHPFKPVSQDFIDYLIEKYDIELCKLYYPPYNFERTGCKGCPFNKNLQESLDVLRKFFPNEAEQCELIWKPVYDEYRRIGYRLKPKEDQMDIWDYMNDLKKEEALQKARKGI